MNDDFLYKFRQPPRREFAAALYQRITNPMSTSFRTRALRAAALSVSLLAVLAAVLFFSPSTRALAQGLIRQFGAYIFVEGAQPSPDKQDLANKQALAVQEKAARSQRPSLEQEATLTAQKQQMEDQPSVKAGADKQLDGNFAPDAAAASQLTGFTVLAPGYIPAGFTPEDMKNAAGGWSIAHENGSVVASAVYENKSDKGFLVIEQSRSEQGEKRTVERPQIVDVTVRGQPGAWMPEDGGKSSLAWDENGITYLVVGNKLSLEEALKIAESLGH